MGSQHVPMRGDAVETWLKSWRDQFADTSGDSELAGFYAYWTLDNVLDDYRLHADTGMPIDQAAEDHGAR